MKPFSQTKDTTDWPAKRFRSLSPKTGIQTLSQIWGQIIAVMFIAARWELDRANWIEPDVFRKSLRWTKTTFLYRTVEIDGAPKGLARPLGPSMYWVRAVRAIALLEHIGTQEAKQLLESLASGEPDALPTEQARAAFDRLKKR
jgi:hypothetical protein